jgi:hypothetical protein
LPGSQVLFAKLVRVRPTGEEGIISRHDVETLLVRACPSFEVSSARQEFHQDYDSEPEPPLYLLASGFVRHLAELNASGHREEFRAVFDVIEDFHLRGDQYVCELATIGFLEGLQNTNLHSANSDAADFVPFLGPVSKWWWEEVELFREGKVIPIGSSGRRHPSNMGSSARAIRDSR